MAFRNRYRRKAPSSPENQGLSFKKPHAASAFFNPSHSVVQRQEGSTPAKPEEEQPIQKQEKQEEEQPVQKQEKQEEMPVQKQENPKEQEPIQAKVDANRANSPSEAQPEQTTDLPDSLKTRIQAMSGLSMENVKVHYNSNKPAQLQALAYAQGNDIYIGPGQERHLPHEAWHVVQQKQGRVIPTLQTKGVNMNDDSGLEQEATTMGQKATEQPAHPSSASTVV